MIAKGAASLSVGTTAGGLVMDAQKGNSLYQMPAQARYPVQADGKTVMLGSMQLPQVVFIEPNPGGITYVGDRGYRGRIVLIANEGHLWAVNHVSMQQYLYSVVGSEVSPSWPMEALKAQAVAARSYALTYHLKPVNQQFYDLGDDEYFQVYKGVATEANTTRQAVNSTGGEFVSYRGGVVESLYAATDDIVMEAFQGRGMSQIGALGLAEKGYTYRQILANYYSGTGVARIQVDIE
jgi:stage II sporulation protein D